MTIQTDPDRSVDHCNPDIDKSAESLSSIRQQKPSRSDGILHNGSLGRPPELRLEQTADENFGSAKVEVEPMTGVTEITICFKLKVKAKTSGDSDKLAFKLHPDRAQHF